MKFDKISLETLINKNLEILIFDTIDSTNKYAKNYVNQRDALIVSLHQSKGRGRYGRFFYSPKNQGLYFSLLLHDQNPGAQIATLTIALAISNTLKNTTIKWPNDILINGKKLGGILCEGVIKNNNFEKIIIGVGINLFLKQPPKELENVITSYHHFDENIDSNKLLANIINEYFRLRLMSNSQIIRHYKMKCDTLKQAVKIDDIVYETVDINNEGHLVCKDRKGTEIIFTASEVTLSG